MISWLCLKSREHAKTKWFVIVALWMSHLSVVGQAEEVETGHYLGTASCAASTCHGGVVGRGPAWRSSWTQWSAKDPHVNAGLVLQNSLSRQIVLRLLGQSDGDVSQREIDAVLRTRCISCHVTATTEQCASEESLGPDFLIGGVACESCHGASEGWLDEHIDAGFSGPERFMSGLRDNDTTLSVTQGCIRCHVGSRSSDGLVRDMNHDMIAAGHPVLRFDMDSYFRALPPHWERTDDASDTPIRTRHVARNATLSAVAQLAGERAQAFSNGQNTPFPEFADYDCFACHQSLSLDHYTIAPRAGNSTMRVSDGLPIWNTWHSVNLLQLPKEELRMLSPNPTNAAELINAATQLADRFEGRAKDAMHLESDTENELREAMNRLKTEFDWHQAAVIFLDVEAVLRELAINDASYEEIRQTLVADVGDHLRFSDGMQSPDQFGSRRRRAFAEQLTQLIGQAGLDMKRDQDPNPIPKKKPNATN